MQRAHSLEKTLMLEKIEGRVGKGVAENEMVGWHHQLNGHESEHTWGDSEGQMSLACCRHRVTVRLDLGTEQQRQGQFYSFKFG